MTMNLTVFDGTTLVTPDLHDGLMLGLKIESDYLTIYCRDTEQHNITLRFGPVVSMQFDNVRQGNIIFGFAMAPIGSLSDVELRAVYLNSQAVDGVQPEASVITSARARLKGCVVLRLTSSYGCEGMAILRPGPSLWQFSQE